jgi:hypothetical protein
MLTTFEYIFGLLSHLSDSQFTLLGNPQSYDIIRWVGHQNIVSTSVIIQVNITALGSVIVPFEIDIWVSKHRCKSESP